MKRNDSTGINNAAWWLPQSMVIVKDDYTAADEAWVNRNLISMNMSGNSAQMGMGDRGDQGMLLIQRMVLPGSKVAVYRPKTVKTVLLPEQVGELQRADRDWIICEIDRLNTPIMTEEEQRAFLNSANAPLTTN